MPDLTESEVATHYRQFLLEVECVQLEQEAVLKCLAQHHGLSRIVLEGFIPEEVAAFGEKLNELKAQRGQLSTPARCGLTPNR